MRSIALLPLTAALALAPAARADDAFTAIWMSSVALIGAAAVGDALSDRPLGARGTPRVPDMVTAKAGAFNVIADNEGSDMPGLFGVEYRSGWSLWRFRPFVGVEATTDASVYGYGGLLIDVHFGPRVTVTPSAAIGGYAQGDGRDLGSVLEFRTGLEAAYAFDDGSRLGVGFHHISNADTASVNPGVETLTATYSLPLDTLLGR